MEFFDFQMPLTPDPLLSMAQIVEEGPFLELPSGEGTFSVTTSNEVAEDEIVVTGRRLRNQEIDFYDFSVTVFGWFGIDAGSVFDANPGMFQDLLGHVQWIVDNPIEFVGWVADHIDEINRSIELTGSEYIDWKTGGWHRESSPIGEEPPR
jgi:hypothetical protein